MEYHHQETVLQFLIGLNESYIGVCGQILMMDPFPSLTKVFNLATQEEMQRMVRNTPPLMSKTMVYSLIAQQPN